MIKKNLVPRQFNFYQFVVLCSLKLGTPNFKLDYALVLAGLTCISFLPIVSSAQAEDTAVVKTNVTILEASNEGSDFNLVNDAYRDELIKLFSYTSYNQVDTVLRELKKAVREKIDLPEGYELLLTLHNQEKGRVQVQALIRKKGVAYMDTVVSILQPGVVFVGGPPVKKGALIIVLETGF